MRKLMEYLPSYYEEVKEINYLFSAEEPEINNLWDALSKVKNNQFISDADTITIRKWEQLLNIYPDNTKALEYRKAVIIMKLSTKAPLTHRWLESWFKGLVGEEKFIVTLDYNLYFLSVILIDDSNNLINDLRGFLRNKIPANLVLHSGTQNQTEPIDIKVSGYLLPNISITKMPYLNWTYNINKEIYAVLSSIAISVTTLPESLKGE